MQSRIGGIREGDAVKMIKCQKCDKENESNMTMFVWDDGEEGICNFRVQCKQCNNRSEESSDFDFNRSHEFDNIRKSGGLIWFFLGLLHKVDLANQVDIKSLAYAMRGVGPHVIAEEPHLPLCGLGIIEDRNKETI